MTRNSYLFALIGALTAAASCTDMLSVDWTKIEDPNAVAESGGAGGEAGLGGEGGGEAGSDAGGNAGESGNEAGAAGNSAGGGAGIGGAGGSAGSAGASGTAGAGGTSGTAGTSGAGGKGGSSGAAGTAGASGSSGAAGSSGASGTAGIGGGGSGGQGPGCGDGLPDAEELCDPPFTVNNCGSDCKAVTSAECITCEEMADCAVFMDCGSVAGNAADGPAQGTPRAQLCNEVLDCVRDSGCAAGLLIDCYCGDVSSSACDSGQGNGDCRSEIERGLETTSPALIQMRYQQYDLYGGGFALSRVNCDTQLCPDSCF